MLSESKVSILLCYALLSTLVLSDHASFPLTAISYYSGLAPCAASHVSGILDSTLYNGCSSNTPISAYGSCICAQRFTSIQGEISIAFKYDAECSTTTVQPYLTAFCGQGGSMSGRWRKQDRARRQHSRRAVQPVVYHIVRLHLDWRTECIL